MSKWQQEKYIQGKMETDVWYKRGMECITWDTEAYTEA